jgi:Family of unknown function (DUF6191)
MWLWWLLGAVAILLVLDRIALWAESRGWIYWRRSRGGGGGGGALADVYLLFQPSRQHIVEEQDRQRLTIVQKETGEPPLGIDLDAGSALLPSPEPPGEDAPPTGDAPEPTRQ